MGKRYPKEFRDDVVRVARSSGASVKQIAADFGVSDASVYVWMRQAGQTLSVVASQLNIDAFG